MRNVGIELGAAILVLDGPIFLQPAAALIAIQRTEMVLVAALRAMRGQLAAGHGHERTIGAFDDLQVANHEAIVQRDRTECVQPLAGDLFHELDANFGDFHVCSPCLCRRSVEPGDRKYLRQPAAAQGGRQTPGVFCMAADAEVGAAATCHLMPEKVELVEFCSEAAAIQGEIAAPRLPPVGCESVGPRRRCGRDARPRSAVATCRLSPPESSADRPRPSKVQPAGGQSRSAAAAGPLAAARVRHDRGKPRLAAARKNGTSLPISAATSLRRSLGQFKPQAILAAISAAAASLDPPARPASIGIALDQLHRGARASMPAASRRRRAARTARLLSAKLR